MARGPGRQVSQPGAGRGGERTGRRRGRCRRRPPRPVLALSWSGSRPLPSTRHDDQRSARASTCPGPHSHPRRRLPHAVLSRAPPSSLSHEPHPAGPAPHRPPVCALGPALRSGDLCLRGPCVEKWADMGEGAHAAQGTAVGRRVGQTGRRDSRRCPARARPRKHCVPVGRPQSSWLQGVGSSGRWAARGSARSCPFRRHLGEWAAGADVSQAHCEARAAGAGEASPLSRGGAWVLPDMSSDLADGRGPAAPAGLSS